MTKNLLLLLMLFSFTACEKFTGDAGIPSYVHIDKILLDAGYGQGTDSSYIADAWIYLNNEYIGTYELPATFPILAQGKQSINIKPGVIVNGIAATRSINPFMKEMTKEVKLTADSTFNLGVLTTTYSDNAVFAWNAIGQEDFEQSGVSIDSIAGSSTSIVKSKKDVYEGDYSGYIHLDSSHPNFKGLSIKEFDMPANHNGTILEIHVKNPDNLFHIGLYLNLPGGTVVKDEYLHINPGEHWKKLYVNFTGELNNYASAGKFKVYFYSSLDAGQQEAEIFLDNIKLIHF